MSFNYFNILLLYYIDNLYYSEISINRIGAALHNYLINYS